MDLMLALTEHRVHRLIWTEALLAEWERVIVRERHRTPGEAARIVTAIRTYFPEREVREGDYAHLVKDMPGSDPDDRLHMAAACAGNARAIVTWNRADFPAEPLRKFGLQVQDPDTYLCGLVTELPDQVGTTVVDLAAGKRRPPKTPHDLADDLRRAGVSQFADKLRALLGARAEADAWRR